MTFNREKDLVSAGLHALGCALAIVGTVALLLKGAALSPWHVVSYAVFGATMIGLYAASTTYCSTSPSACTTSSAASTTS